MWFGGFIFDFQFSKAECRVGWSFPTSPDYAFHSFVRLHFPKLRGTARRASPLCRGRVSLPSWARKPSYAVATEDRPRPYNFYCCRDFRSSCLGVNPPRSPPKPIKRRGEVTQDVGGSIFVFPSLIVVKSLGIGDLTLPFVLTNQYRSVILLGKRRGSVKVNRCTKIAPHTEQQ